MVHLLDTVKTPKVVVILAAAVNAAAELGITDVTVTSGNDSTHMKGSKHYTDEAFDFRTRTITRAQAARWREVIQQHLGGAYQAILEIDHIHVEFDPHPIQG